MFTSKKEVMFFLSFLNNLVPFESAEYLKVHLLIFMLFYCTFREDDSILLQRRLLQNYLIRIAQQIWLKFDSVCGFLVENSFRPMKRFGFVKGMY